MADYDINAVTRRVVYTGSAGTGPYSFTFEVLDQNDLAVYFNSTKLTLTTDYTVSINANGTGSITIVTGTNVPSTPTASDQITILGARDIERTTDFVTAGDLRASALNEQLDGQIIMTQQIAEEQKRTLAAPPYDPAHVDDGGTLNMTLPAKDTRKGKYLAFNSTTGNPEAGASSDDVATLASITDDIATLADIEDGTDATDAIQTVAGISGNVSTVAGVSSSVTTVAGISSNVTTVAGISSNVTTVAGIAADVTTTAGISADVTTVAADGTDIGTVAGISADVTTVAGIAANVTTVAADGTDIGVVSGISANVTTVAGIAANVTTVAGISADVTTVAADGTDIGVVSGISANVTTVAGISGNVTTVAGISSDVTAVAGDATDIGTVATDLAGSNTIGTVAGIAADVTTVAGISGDVSSVAAQVVGYAFSTTTTMADPGSGNVRFNNATVSSVTAIAIDDLDSNGVDQSAYIAIWDDSTNTVKGTLVFRTVGGDIATFSITGLTDNTGWFQIAVTHVASSGTFSAAEDCYIGFTRAGDKGADGAGSGDVSGPGAAVTDNAVVRWDTTSGQLVQNSTVVITDADNVGIGTAAPENPMTIQDIAGSTFNRDFSIRNGDATNYHRLTLGYNAGSLASGVPANAQFLLAEKGGGYGTSGGLVLGNSDNAPVIFTTNATERMHITGAGNVGIGTSAPAYNLDIKNGTTYSADSDNWLTAIQQNGNASAANGLSVMNAWAASTSKIFEAAMGWNGVATGYYPVFTIDGLGQVIFSPQSSEAMRIDSSGNVGIGTSSPNQKLQVAGSNGTGFAGATLQNSNANVGIAGIQFSSDTTYSKAAIGQLRQNPNGTGPLVFYVDTATDAADWSTGDEKMRIESSGNVGIGTTSPSTALQVNGTITATTFGTSSQNAYGARTVSTSGPSGGADGDIWYKY